MKEIYLAGGCFWGVESLYEKLDGVADTAAGYANGKDASGKDANYPAVCTGKTGFRETVRVRYDESRIGLKELLFAYFCVVHTNTPGRQGADIGDQYQAGIYWTDPEDEAAVMKYASIEGKDIPGFAVELKPLENFFEAEEYHQKYLDKNPQGYCHISREKTGFLSTADLRSVDYSAPAEMILARLTNKKSYLEEFMEVQDET